MKQKILYLIISLTFNLNSFAFYHSEEGINDSINDGPYIFNINDSLKVKWIENNVLREDYVLPGNFTGIKNKFNLFCSYEDLNDTYLIKPDFNQSYSKVDSISVITDIHGEYNSYINLLIANGIIDKNLKWSFGKGHLVILGDSFDRGNMVTEILWHLFGLEKQAAEAGGMVHVILGNHEVLVLGKDVRYINDKYKIVEVISNTKYFDLYSENSVLGKWLRSKPVMISINNIIFVHGGISMDLVKRNLKIRQINEIFSDSVVGKDLSGTNESEQVMFLDENNGPLWYRGYFNDTTFCESRLDSILGFFGKEHIVVGHTSYNEIRTLFNYKIFGVDAGIMNRQPGEMLIVKNGYFYKGYITGKRVKL
jgi:hypothetical protein